MTTNLSNTHCYFAPLDAEANNAVSISPILTTESRFAALCAVVFDSVKMQEVVGKEDVSNILKTIASISNNHGCK